MAEIRGIPGCLNRRYQALDNLIQELSSAVSTLNSDSGAPVPSCADPSIKLMCDFWNILKEDPDCDLPNAVQQRMCLNKRSSARFPQHVTCYMASEGKDNSKSKYPQPDSYNSKCCNSGAASSVASRDAVPLSKVLCNLKEAASHDKQCNARLKDLLVTEKQLQDQIQVLEQREKEGAQMLKQADCMWSCMEESYKQKIAESLERQKNLLTQLKEVETSTTKWRKNKKDLESQLSSISKCKEEITGKINQKTNDMKCMDKEIGDFKKRIDSNKKDSEASKGSLAKKRANSDATIAKIAAQVKSLENTLKNERNRKRDKEIEGGQYIKEARDDLQKMCRVLLQKKLENEDLAAEQDAVLIEIDLLKQTCDTCKDRCKNKQQSVENELKTVQAQINNFKNQCIRCHQCTDTEDVRKFCTDCPKCMQDRECIYSEDHCSPDQTLDCVCQSVKHKFLDNVFENMYTVLERQANSKPGKAVAEAVLSCLKRSRNGKLNEETRNILQDFILTTVKKNLNLTIVGGAVKTRCEMEPETYAQLMTCLKQVKATRAPRVDVGTAAKKDSCRRWGGPSECNCPKGPKDCVCTIRAPKPPDDPTPCPPQDKEDEGYKVVCPHKKDTSCGPDCGAREVPSMVGTDVSAWKPDPCRGPTCNLKNMRAAQCVLGPESLATKLGYKQNTPYAPVAVLEDQITCKCGNTPMKPCTCKQDIKQLKAGINKNNSQDTGDCATVLKTCEGGNRKAEKRRENVDKNGMYSCHSFQKSNAMDSFILVQRRVPKKSKEKLNKSQLKIAIQTDNNSTASSQYTQIINTSSGTLAMELDELVIKDIKVKTKDNPNLYASIKETKSGNYLIDFDCNDTGSCDSPKVLFKRTISGNLSLEIDKSLINNSKTNSYLSALSSLSIEITKKRKCSDPAVGKNVELIENVRRQLQSEIMGIKSEVTNAKECHNNGSTYPSRQDNSVSIEANFPKENKQSMRNEESHGGTTKKSLDNKTRQILKSGKCFDTFSDENSFMTAELRSLSSLDFIKMYRKKSIDSYKDELRKVKRIQLKVEKNGKIIDNIKADVKHTFSGNVAIYIKHLSSMAHISKHDKEWPVLLKRSKSGKYVLHVGSGNALQVPNTVLNRTVSGQFLVVLKDPSVNEVTSDVMNDSIPKEELFKVKIKGVEDTAETPILLKLTTSGNYELVLDKEFEIHYRKSISKCLGVQNECYIEFERENNETVIINFENNFGSHNKVNALLFRTASNHIKILVNDPLIDSLLPDSSTASRRFNKLLKRIPKNEQRNPISWVNQLMEVKSSSDSNLYKKGRSRQNILDGASATLKKMASGQYAIVLNKESKKKFLNDLKSYIASSSYGRIPICEGSKSGEITIALSGTEESLKITPSGNIYVLINEDVIKTVTKDVENDQLAAENVLKHVIGRVSVSSIFNPESKHIIKEIMSPKDKHTTTNCNAKDDPSCDPGKCVCRDLQINYRTVNEFFTPKICAAGNIELTISSNSDNDPQYTEPCCSTAIITPQIVIKPNESRPIYRSRSNAQCFRVTETECPIHKGRYDTMSNDVIEITGLCNTVMGNVEMKSKFVKVGNKNWNSLEYLELQLPSFLRDFKYS